LKLNGTAASEEGFGLETIGATQAGVGALIGLGLEGLGTLLAHGFIDEQADALGEAAGAFLVEELQNGVQKFRIALVGHFGVELAVFADTPTGNQDGPPSTSFSRAERPSPFGARLRSARYARLRSASPQRGRGAWKKDNLQNQIHTNAFGLNHNVANGFSAITWLIQPRYTLSQNHKFHWEK